MVKNYVKNQGKEYLQIHKSYQLSLFES
jgi:hypothetical protein